LQTGRTRTGEYLTPKKKNHRDAVVGAFQKNIEGSGYKGSRKKQ